MTINTASCFRCRQQFEANELRPVPFGFRLVAGLSLGPVHAGMWLWEELSRDHCAHCRKWLSFLTLILASLSLFLGIWALRWAARQGLMPAWISSHLL